MTDMRGTGDTFIEIELPGLGTWALKDDGDSDHWAAERFTADPGGPVQSGTNSLREALMDVRRADAMPDSDLKQIIEQGVRAAVGDGGGSGARRPPRQKAHPRTFLCDSCNLQNPWKWNVTPDGPENICRSCGDD